MFAYKCKRAVAYEIDYLQESKTVMVIFYNIYTSDSQLGLQERTSWDENFFSLTIGISDDNRKNITSNGARGAKMIFPSRRGAGFKKI